MHIDVQKACKLYRVHFRINAVEIVVEMFSKLMESGIRNKS